MPCSQGKNLFGFVLFFLEPIAHMILIQTPAEISLMQYTNYISSLAHVDVMRKARPGMMEYQLESLFMHHTYYYGGCRFMSYTCICACGPNGKNCFEENY